MADAADGHGIVRGMTISCQTWGWEWGSGGFSDELARLGDLGVNWIAIHPYASIHADGSVGQMREALDPDAPPVWLTRPRQATTERNIALLIKPHLAYWGSPFRWRGEIAFEDDDARARFWRDYGDWIVKLARATSSADAFCVGTELNGMQADEAEWRKLIARVRGVTDAQLTYAANWDRFEDVPFWDALDAVGVQAYFPLATGDAPTAGELLEGWGPVLERLRALHVVTGKPIVFTELGYSASPRAASRPWEDPDAGVTLDHVLQRRCLTTALDVLARESEWLRGAFLWKWFVGGSRPRPGSFLLDEPELHDVIRRAWH